jgi:hypothetical protein
MMLQGKWLAMKNPGILLSLNPTCRRDLWAYRRPQPWSPPDPEADIDDKRRSFAVSTQVRDPGLSKRRSRSKGRAKPTMLRRSQYL